MQPAHDEPLGEIMRILNCACGEEAKLRTLGDAGHTYLVECKQLACWIGRTCPLEVEAIRNWNLVMGLIIGVQSAFEKIEEANFETSS